MKKSIPVALTLIVVVSLFRLLPHPMNFTPIGAIALFSGAYLSKKWIGWIMPLMILFVSDVVLQITTGNGFHSSMIAVYGTFLAITLIGSKRLQENVSTTRILTSSIASSLLFFITTNFSVWLFDGSNMYSNDLVGLAHCYINAIPFYNNDLLSSFALNGFIGDLFFNGIIFGAYALVSKGMIQKRATIH